MSTLLLIRGSAGHAFDSATSACRQNPGYCARIAGEETVVPTTLRGAAEVASMAATLEVLTPNMKSSIERELVECAEWANETVNRQHFGGNNPSRSQCQEELGKDPCGRKVTRAMQLGNEKHRLALQCAKQKLGARIPGRFSVEQRYRYDQQTGKKQLVGSEEEHALRQQGCADELVGTLVPDVVIHSGNPLEVLAVYDFKFPCPTSNEPRWNDYPKGHPYHESNQGAMYHRALGVRPFRVAPIWRIY
ncbi:hypothetical protein JQX13_35795 [Archangium violaceum]|uniref:hypothetical protein n=1 Tax=Archangium violaceum TaxID=83451 RepID=UPI00193C422A|nr:hypothetical protein [Archangium violaceum]QRK05496.1 hypothetical protein JQX13_35795 [Archangium violaceum]